MLKKSTQKKPKYDMIAIGEAVLDVFLEVDEATVACQVKKEECQICFDFGEKIPVTAVTRVPGAGNASNVAVGSSRLGLSSAVYSVIGNDQAAKEIRQNWKNEHVAMPFVVTDKKRPTSYSTILFKEGERTILVYHEPRKYELPKLPSASWIYYTSIGAGHEKLEKQLIAHLKQHPHTPVSFNPGTHQLRRGLKSLLPIIKLVTVFIVNKEEAEYLLQTKEATMRTLLQSFIDLGVKIAVITDGLKGSYATDGTTFWHQPIFNGDAYERTGAGDAFGTGFSYALATGHEIPEALRYGTANSWSVVKYIGPQKGLLTKAQMKTVLKKYASTKTELLKD